MAALPSSVSKVLPLPIPPRPKLNNTKSSTMRQRHKFRMQVHRIAVGMISVINGLDSGDVYDKVTKPADTLPDSCRTKASAGRLATGHILREASNIAKVRRGLT